MTEILDLALSTAKRYMRQSQYGKAWFPEGVNVLVTGLPGSGKTSIVKAWANNRGLNFIEVNAKDNSIEELIYGIKIPEKGEDGKTKITEKRPESLVNRLHQKNSVLFLDEFNRQTDPKIRGSLLDLINKREINTATGESLYFSDSLLFTVACINPAVSTDKGAKPLIDAEKSRFLLKGTFDSDKTATKNFLNYDMVNKLASLGVDVSKMARTLGVKAVELEQDPTENMTDDERADYYKNLDIEEQLKIFDLGNFIVSDPDFEYDTKDDLFDLASEDKTMLNQRYLYQGLQMSGGDVNKFEKWVEFASNLLDKDINMLLGITRKYHLDLDSLYKAAGITKSTVASAKVNAPAEDDAAMFNDGMDEEDPFAAPDQTITTAAQVSNMLDDLASKFSV